MGVELAFGGGAPHRYDGLHRQDGEIYGQTEVHAHLMETARTAAGLTTIYQAGRLTPHDFFDTDSSPRFLCQGTRRPRHRCDFIAGCDGFHGVSP